MATRRYMINRGETEQNVTQAAGAAVATKNLEVTFDLAANMTKQEVLQALQMIKNYILKSNFPPA